MGHFDVLQLVGWKTLTFVFDHTLQVSYLVFACRCLATVDTAIVSASLAMMVVLVTEFIVADFGWYFTTTGVPPPMASGGWTMSGDSLGDILIRIGGGVLFGCSGPLGLLIPFFASTAVVRMGSRTGRV